MKYKAKREILPKIRCFADLMDYIEEEAKRRINKIREKYLELAKNNPHEKVILKVMKDFKESLSVDAISFLTGINKSECCKTLRKLKER